MNVRELWRKRLKPADLTVPGRELAEDEYFNKEDGLIYCSKCRTPRQTLMEFGGFGVLQRLPVPCKCRTEELERRERAMNEAQRRARADANRAKGVADTIYHQYRFENDRGYNAEALKMAKKYVSEWDEVKKENRGLLLWGDIGTGKSFTAACIANAVIDKGARAMMTGLPWLVEELTGRHFNSKNEFIESLNRYDLLVIDDLGTERGSAYSVAYKRIYDRILAMSVPLKMNEVNIRRIKAAENTARMKELLRG